MFGLFLSQISNSHLFNFDIPSRSTAPHGPSVWQILKTATSVLGRRSSKKPREPDLPLMIQQDRLRSKDCQSKPSLNRLHALVRECNNITRSLSFFGSFVIPQGLVDDPQHGEVQRQTQAFLLSKSSRSESDRPPRASLRIQFDHTDAKSRPRIPSP